ncbi:MAG: hypothetical protein ACN4GZ_20525 [Acidimicrobiales bacterium]
MASSEPSTIDSSFGIPAHLAEAASPPSYRPSWRVRTPIWQRIISLGALGGIAVGVGVALAVTLIGIAILTLMLLEAAIG